MSATSAASATAAKKRWVTCDVSASARLRRRESTDSAECAAIARLSTTAGSARGRRRVRRLLSGWGRWREYSEGAVEWLKERVRSTKWVLICWPNSGSWEGCVKCMKLGWRGATDEFAAEGGDDGGEAAVASSERRADGARAGKEDGVSGMK